MPSRPVQPAPPGPTAKRILITGARGRLASCLIPLLRSAGHEVVPFSRAGGDGFHAMDTLGSNQFMDQADCVFHLAWSSLPATAELAAGHEPPEDLALLRRLLDRWANCPAPPQLVFFSSGGTVYGPTGGQAAKETTPGGPIGHYGRMKLRAEEMIGQQAAARGLPAAILRISNPYGFNQPLNRAQGIIPRAFHCARTGRPLSLWGDGSAQKDFIHRADFLRALCLVVERKLTGTYNIAQGRSHRIREVLAEIELITGRPVAVETSPARPWDVHDVLLDNEKIRAATGWQPEISLAEGLRLTHEELSRTPSG